MNPHFTNHENNLYNHLIQTRNLINNYLINNYSDSLYNYTPYVNPNPVPLNSTSSNTLRSVRNSMDNLINTLNTPLRYTRQGYNLPRQGYNLPRQGNNLPRFRFPIPPIPRQNTTSNINLNTN